jgi:hypothetical protein
MKKGFPNKILFIKIGWSDVCKIGSYYDDRTQSMMVPICGMCNGRLRVGREKEQLFKYCPSCLTKK